jgi:lysozyme
LKTSGVGLALIQHFEGIRLQAYQCPAGVWTIGFGHTAGVKAGDTIDSDTADRLFRSDVAQVEKQVSAVLKHSVTQSQFDALVCFTFNIGIVALTKSTLLRRLNEGDALSASDEFLKWNKADGKAVVGLTRRRFAERKLFKSVA